ncbi:hypothetical protein TNCV_1007151 [Trichonephila clavipes]|nr:hypothetical protein TNCV_1007151 [Trichonephila clavipes]
MEATQKLHFEKLSKPDKREIMTAGRTKAPVPTQKLIRPLSPVRGVVKRGIWVRERIICSWILYVDNIGREASMTCTSALFSATFFNCLVFYDIRFGRGESPNWIKYETYCYNIQRCVTSTNRTQIVQKALFPRKGLKNKAPGKPLTLYMFFTRWRKLIPLEQSSQEDELGICRKTVGNHGKST